MGEHATYVYAVGDALPSDSDVFLDLRGVDDARVRTISEGALAAVVSDVDPVRFGDKSLQTSLEDLSWLQQTALAHNTVLAALAAEYTVAPLRMATVYNDDDSVRATLRTNAEAFSAVLARVRGRSEWGVKGFVQTRDFSSPTLAGEKPGTSYLMRKRAERDRIELAREKWRNTADAVHAAFAKLAVTSFRYPPQDPRLSGRRDEMVLNSAFLVEDARAAEFCDAVHGGAGEDIYVELTGPWAPYSFTALEKQ